MLRRIGWFLLLTLVALSSVAVVVSRTVGPTGAFKTIRASQRAAVDGSLHVPMELGARVLNCATGEVTRLPAPRGEFLEWPAFSEWIDEKGEWSVVGRWVATSSEQPGDYVIDRGLARFAFPSGRRLESVGDCPLPGRAPCWYPGPTPRVLYAAIDGRLYECTFGGAQPPTINPVAWTEWPAGYKDPYIESVTWPKLPRLKGRILATVGWYKAPAERSATRFWWLTLDHSGSTVKEAIPASIDVPIVDEAVAWRSPALAQAPDGGLVIAWLRYVEPSPLAELLVARVRATTPMGDVAIIASEAHTVADGLLAMPPVFSPDSKWVYGLQGELGKASAVQRFAVPLEPGA